MKSATVRLAQQMLAKEGFDPGTPDGKTGPNTYQAVNLALSKHKAEVPGWDVWPDSRKLVAYLQLCCKERDIEVGEIDGFWGPQTDYACDSLQCLVDTGSLPKPWRDDTPLDVNPNGWPSQNQEAVFKFYGETGKNQVLLTLPYPHRYSWQMRTVVKSFQCHAKVRDSAQRVLQRVFVHYGYEKIKELRLDVCGGCLNERKMRGGSNLSMHSWGIAIDYDPDNNSLHWGRNQASLAKPVYDPWWRFWEEEGWTSLGRTKNYDWMHVQATHL